MYRLPTMFNHLQFKAWQIAKEHGWHDEQRSFGDVLALMHSELSEALEDYRAGHLLDEIYYEGEKPCGIAVEFADVLIRILDTCEQNGIPLEEALRLKMQYNETREYRHGGKLL